MFLPVVLGSLLAMSAPSPVSLATCDVSSQQTALPAIDDASPTTFEYSFLHVNFTNVQSRTISRIQFTLDDGTNVTDRGTFSQNVAIDHSFDIGSARASSCRVTAVTFTDGTSWEEN